MLCRIQIDLYIEAEDMVSATETAQLLGRAIAVPGIYAQRPEGGRPVRVSLESVKSADSSQESIPSAEQAGGAA